MSVRDGLRKIGAAFLLSSEVSSQECVYRCMPELWLRKIFQQQCLLVQIYQIKTDSNKFTTGS